MLLLHSIVIFTCSLLLPQLTAEIEEPEMVTKFIQDNLVEWEPPEEILQNYPYYWSGFDFEDRPVWIVEFGKWDLRRISESDNATLQQFDNYISQIVYNLFQSLKANHSDQEVVQIIGIADMDGWSTKQMTKQNVAYIMEKFQYLAPLVRKYVNYIYIINTNYVAESVVNILRPILGSVMEKVEVWGTRKSKWLPPVLSRVPTNQLPEWYGGGNNFKPLKSYGK